ncbi:type II toxin-antitoxin system RelE family toxin [Argonema antarcticum]|uniref:type II toxin-antitoxin system RelE family toxin n=1 Tax=Argonema antarcticum TaxID=2942763 RepID=UPI002010CDD9|nr:type II toxin-antitoxin system RelE/ParE family toxin [Argonema antarcticum A004/B2]
MNTQYLPSFIKDLKALKSTPVFESIKALVFEEIPDIPNFEDIPNLKKLKGYENAYRIRLGDYRIGVVFDGKTVTYYRTLHRKEFYRYFP